MEDLLTIACLRPTPRNPNRSRSCQRPASRDLYQRNGRGSRSQIAPDIHARAPVFPFGARGLLSPSLLQPGWRAAFMLKAYLLRVVEKTMSDETCRKGRRRHDRSFDLQRFVDAQAPVYPRVVAELRRGEKQSHWMWFIFPQLAGLGHSPMAQRYAITSRDEALAYLGHAVLGSPASGMHGAGQCRRRPNHPANLGQPRRPEIPLVDDVVRRGVVPSRNSPQAIAKFYDGAPDRRRWSCSRG